MIYPKALSGPAVAGPRAPAPTYRGVLGSARPKQAGPRTSTTASRAQNLNHEVLTPPFRLPCDSLPLPPSPSGFL